MRIFKRSILFYDIDGKNDKVKCIYIYFINWFNFKIEINIFDLKILNMKHIIEFHEQLQDEWDSIYRI